MDKRTIEDFFDSEYRAYALYTIENRAIPSLVDGFKPAQRKITFAANRLWKTGSEKPKRVATLGSEATAMSHYHHGSLDETIITMTQEFKNSLPIFQGVGQFGSLRDPKAGASRYVAVRFNDNFRRLYKDFELVTPQYEEGEEIEPKFFLPIIPTVLLNGSSGVAVGFATNILNRHPIDLIDASVDILKTGSSENPLKPWVRGFNGSVELVPDSKGRAWAFTGIHNIKNTSVVEVTEIPPGITYEKYVEYLGGLVEKGVIHSYEDASSDQVRYVLRFPRAGLAALLDKEKLDDTLKMRETETENLTTLDENGKLKVFGSAPEIMEYFVAFRLGYYDLRKQYLLKDIARETALLDGKAKFVQAVIDGTVVVANAPKSAIVSQIQTAGIPKQEGGFDYLLSMPIYSLTAEKIKELLAKIKAKFAEKVQVENTTPTEFYLNDLAELRKQLVSHGWKVPPPPTPAKLAPTGSPVKAWLNEGVAKPETKAPVQAPVLDSESILDALDDFFGG